MKIKGWIPDLPDHRDLSYRKELRPQNRLLKGILRPSSKYLHADNLPRVYNQGQIGSCVGHGVAECVSYALDYNDATGRLDGKMPRDLSRLFAYYNARTNKNEDEGAYIREGVKAAAKFGICTEEEWPYYTSRWAVRPPEAAYTEAAGRKAISYYRIDTLVDLIDCVAQGYPIVYGMTLFESFDDVGRDGVVTMPTPGDGAQGGHCMIIVGYSMKRRAFYVRNSWGEGWGDRGNCWVPFQYICDYGDDFWTVRKVATK